MVTEVKKYLYHDLFNLTGYTAFGVKFINLTKGLLNYELITSTPFATNREYRIAHKFDPHLVTTGI